MSNGDDTHCFNYVYTRLGSCDKSLASSLICLSMRSETDPFFRFNENHHGSKHNIPISRI
nr:MAG TPA: hypothetical protein [Caudoviricetes sp.]